MPITPVPDTAPRWGGRIAPVLGRAALWIFRWRIDGAIPPVSKLVAIGAPHTCTLDVFVALMAKLALGLRLRWMGKHTIFREPLGTVARFFGGMPVDRRSSQSIVQQAVTLFATEERLFLCIAPEGTRQPVARWKTGFYHIAVGARVPILTVALDYSRRAVVIGEPLMPSGDIDADVALLRRHFHAGMARHPERYL